MDNLIHALIIVAMLGLGFWAGCEYATPEPIPDGKGLIEERDEKEPPLPEPPEPEVIIKWRDRPVVDTFFVHVPERYDSSFAIIGLDKLRALPRGVEVTSDFYALTYYDPVAQRYITNKWVIPEDRWDFDLNIGMTAYVQGTDVSAFNIFLAPSVRYRNLTIALGPSLWNIDKEWVRVTMFHLNYRIF